jgi:DHA2 family methylenomycin A resistance protein-like MFS transporter
VSTDVLTTSRVKGDAAHNVPHPAPPRWALWASVLGMFVVTLDALIVNVALPTIGRELGGGGSAQQWVLDGYTLMFAALLLSTGSLSDRIGARRAFTLGLLVFVTASALCGLAPDLPVLVAARFVQGAGAVVMLPATLALIREAFPDPAERSRAIAVWAVGGAVASAAGPVLGGVLCLASWRLIFFVNLPVGLLTLLLLHRTARSPRQPGLFDWTGQVSAVLAMTGLTYGVIEGGAGGFTRPAVIAALFVAATALAVFVAAQARGAHPMVPLVLFRNRAVLVSLTGGFAFCVAFYGLVFLMSLYYQQVRGLSAFGAGLAFLPMTGLVAGINLLAPKAAARFGLRTAIVGGLACMAVGLVILAVVPGGTPVAVMAVLMIPVGLGGAMAVPSLTALLLQSVPADQAGVASGVLNTFRQIGGALAVAVYGIVIAGNGGFQHGMRTCLLISAAVVAVTCAGALARRPDPVSAATR